MRVYSIRYQKRARQIREVGLLKVERTPWGEWSEHECRAPYAVPLDKRRAAAFIRAKLNDDAGRGQARNIQVRVLSVEVVS